MCDVLFLLLESNPSLFRLKLRASRVAQAFLKPTGKLHSRTNARPRSNMLLAPVRTPCWDSFA